MENKQKQLNKILLLIGIWCLFTVRLNAQQVTDTIFSTKSIEVELIDQNWHHALVTDTLKKYKYFQFFDDSNVLIATQFWRNGKKWGKSISYYENGKIKQKGCYKRGKKIGKHHYFDFSGHKTRTEIYHKRKGLIAEYYPFNDTINVFTIATRMSVFGGYSNEIKGFTALGKFIDDQVEKPDFIASIPEKVPVTASFLINPKGEIKFIEILQSAYPQLSEQVAAILKKMPRWRPAKFKGRKVWSEFSVTVNF